MWKLEFDKKRLKIRKSVEVKINLLVNWNSVINEEAGSRKEENGKKR